MTNATYKDFIREDSRCVSIYYPSMVDIIEQAKKYTGPNTAEVERTLTKGHGRDWLGPTNNMPSDVLNHAVTGDAEMLAKLDKIIAEFNISLGDKLLPPPSKVTESKRRRIRSKMGDELDIHKVYQGQLDKAWSKTERVIIDRIHNLYTIVFDIDANSTVHPSATYWDAAVALRIVRELEAAGKSVRVVLVAGGVNTFAQDRRLLSCGFVLKEYGQHLAMERIAAMSHLGFWRVIGFLLHMLTTQRIAYGYGQHMTIRQNNQLPIQIQEEIAKGHTKIVRIPEARSKYGALESLKSAYRQIKGGE